jgi:hypothetical protein
VLIRSAFGTNIILLTTGMLHTNLILSTIHPTNSVDKMLISCDWLETVTLVISSGRSCRQSVAHRNSSFLTCPSQCRLRPGSILPPPAAHLCLTTRTPYLGRLFTTSFESSCHTIPYQARHCRHLNAHHDFESQHGGSSFESHGKYSCYGP